MITLISIYPHWDALLPFFCVSWKLVNLLNRVGKNMIFHASSGFFPSDTLKLFLSKCLSLCNVWTWVTGCLSVSRLSTTGCLNPVVMKSPLDWMLWPFTLQTVVVVVVVVVDTTKNSLAALKFSQDYKTCDSERDWETVLFMSFDVPLVCADYQRNLLTTKWDKSYTIWHTCHPSLHQNKIRNLQ